MVADPSYYIFLKGEDLLLPHKSEHFDAVAVDKDTEDYMYTGVRISNVVIGYNTDLVKPEDAPKTFRELTDPKWKDQVVIVDPTQSGTALNSTYALSQKYGWEYFEQLRDNGAVIGGGNSSTETKLVTGEFAVAIILEENLLKVKDRGEPVEIVYPEDGVIIIPSPIGILKTTQNPEAAKAVVDWWLSPEGQRAIVTGWMHSVRTDVESPKGAKPLAEFAPTAMELDWHDLRAAHRRDQGQVRGDHGELGMRLGLTPRAWPSPSRWPCSFSLAYSRSSCWSSTPSSWTASSASTTSARSTPASPT